ncbi:flagellar assembly protein FliW [Gracilibacillus sp. YIM 98692]|uniref:flagellar assembly protein FliW n=1 Tax=Gracilibacillus sp. YIM 98692 TaxID=2663532 RepID=UPI0013D5FF00|nr:flagellar assembly protein FliW [Gracilibacillus sp. YIM 98692]
MNIQTKYFGEIEINEQEIIHFPQGIPGFAEEKNFALLSFEENGLFQVLQSTKQKDPAFVVIDPFLFEPNYQLKLDDATINQLEIQEEKDVRVLAIVTVKDPLEQSTANLQGPIIINRQSKKAKQFIINQSSYTTKETIFKQTSKVEEE